MLKFAENTNFVVDVIVPIICAISGLLGISGFCLSIHNIKVVQKVKQETNLLLESNIEIRTKTDKIEMNIQEIKSNTNNRTATNSGKINLSQKISDDATAQLCVINAGDMNISKNIPTTQNPIISDMSKDGSDNSYGSCSYN